MKVTLVKIYIEEDHHDIDVEMFRVYKEIDTLIEPKVGHYLTLDKGEFYIEKLEQNIKKGKVYLYETHEISHYDFWGNRAHFLEKYLPVLLKEGWKCNQKECKNRFLSQAMESDWRRHKIESGDINAG